VTAGVLALAVMAATTSTVTASGQAMRNAVALTEARVTAATEAATSCPTLTPARLVGQVMATTGFEPGAGGGIAGLSSEEWEQWKPWGDAVPSDETASLLALAHLTCDLVGQLRVSGFSGDLWLPAVAAFASSLDDVRAAAGVPASVAEVVDRAQAYASHYTELFGPAPTPSAMPSTSADTQPTDGATGPTATPSPTPSTLASSAPPSPTPTPPSAPTSAPTSAQNSFSVALSSTSASVTQGSATTVTVTTAVTSGSAQSVSLSASGLPAGVTASFSPTTVTAGGSSTLTLQTSGSTPTATSTVTVRASGSVTRTASLSLTVTSPPCSSPGQKLGNPGFESGSSPWSATSNVIRSYSYPHSGARVAWLGGHDDEHTDTLTQTVSLPAGCASYTFSFWLHINSSEQTSSTQYDTMTVRVLTSGGSVLTTLATYSNLNEASGYSKKSFNLASYAGQTIQLKFTSTEDYSRQTSFVVDDTALDVA
jgi:hypothetical protein